METTSRQTQCPVCKILQRYIEELKLTVLLVLTESTYLTWRICFYFLGKPLLGADHLTLEGGGWGVGGG